MTAMPVFDAAALGSHQVPLSRRLYDSMISSGELTKEHKVELIYGQLVAKMPIGTKHSGMVNALANVLFSKLTQRAVISVQNPVALHEFSEPEPDLSVLRPPVLSYQERHPEPADIFFLIEVADSSLRFDREGKVPLYASCDIPETWLVDVNDKAITIFSQPDGTAYQQITTYKSGDSIRLSMFPDVEIALSDLGW
jgi:Uma2 family endonuclease